jgi:hypothetical protein
LIPENSASVRGVVTRLAVNDWRLDRLPLTVSLVRKNRKTWKKPVVCRFQDSNQAPSFLENLSV